MGAIGASYYDEIWIDRDPWFASLRADAAFPEHRRRWAAQKGERLLDQISASSLPQQDLKP
jgi:hypothetical protein